MANLADNFRQVADEFRKIDLEKIGLESIEKVSNEFVNANTDQLYQGEDSEGRKLPEYSQRSVNVFGKPPGSWRLFESGDFYRGVFLKPDKFPVEFDSRDSKTGMLLNKLDAKGFSNPEKIFGTNKENTDDLVRNQVLPVVIEKVREALPI